MSTEKTKTNDWIVTTDRCVGFLDIMGFKDLVARNSHLDVLDIMTKVSETIKKHIKKEGLIKSYIATFSDSIVVFSQDHEQKSINSFILTMAYLQRDLIKEGIPFKGAAAFGEVTCDIENSIFFGQAVIDAYLLQEEVGYYGVVIHGSLEGRLIGGEANVFEYDSPLKTSNVPHLTIAPAFASWKNKPFSSLAEEIDAELHKWKYKTSGKIRSYIINTLRYIKYINNELNKRS